MFNLSKQVVVMEDTKGLVVMEDTKGSVQRLFSGTVGSFWLSRFQQGCRLRMGQQTRQDQAISTKLMILLLEFCENKVQEEPDIESMEKRVKAGALFVISYVLSLRGNEGILLDIEGLQQFDQERNELLAVPLVGKLKGSGQVKRHILRSVKVTSSGINVNWWMTYFAPSCRAKWQKQRTSLRGQRRLCVDFSHHQ